MRPLETVVLLALAPVVLALFRPAGGRPRWIPLAALAAVAGSVLHLLIEGYRWQMVPAYLLTTALLPGTLRVLRRSGAAAPPVAQGRKWLRVVGAAVVLLLFALAALIPAMMPVFELPKPSGEFPVGTTRFSLLDAARDETFTADPADKRELLVHVWYPAQPAPDSRPEPLWGDPEVLARRLARSIGMPFFLFDHFSLVRTHAYRDAALADSRRSYPVLIFSHGYNQGVPVQNTVQMEELASHGYVVFSIGHSYESLALLHPDGRIVEVSQGQTQRVLGELRKSVPLIRQMLDSPDAAERERLMQKVSDSGPTLTASVGVWTADTRFVLEQLARLDGAKEPRQFTGRLDLGRVGVFGMSFGGTVATDFCLTDSRCRAGINLDGLQFGPAAMPGTALKVPFMFMASGLLNDPVFRRAQASAWYLTVKSATHLNFSDFSLISPLFSKLGLLGPIRGQRMEAIMNAYILAFFDQHLRDAPAALLTGPSPDYPEVALQQRAGVTP